MIGPGIHSYPWVAFFASFLAMQERRRMMGKELQVTTRVRMQNEWFFPSSLHAQRRSKTIRQDGRIGRPQGGAKPRGAWTLRIKSTREKAVNSRAGYLSGGRKPRKGPAFFAQFPPDKHPSRHSFKRDPQSKAATLG